MRRIAKSGATRQVLFALAICLATDTLHGQSCKALEDGSVFGVRLRDKLQVEKVSFGGRHTQTTDTELSQIEHQWETTSAVLSVDTYPSGVVKRIRLAVNRGFYRSPCSKFRLGKDNFSRLWTLLDNGEVSRSEPMWAENEFVHYGETKKSSRAIGITIRLSRWSDCGMKDATACLAAAGSRTGVPRVLVID